MKYNVILILILFLIVSCQIKSNNTFISRECSDEITTIDLSDLTTKPLNMDTLVCDVKYILPEAVEGSYLSEYKKIIALGDTVFILNTGSNQEAIFAFNIKGDYLFKIDRRGKGLGEYMDIDDFYVNGKLKEIGILTRSKILKYDFDGVFKNQIVLKKEFILRVQQSDSLLYCYSGPLGFNKSPYGVSVFTTDGKLLFKDHPIPVDIANYHLRKGNYLTSNSQNCYVNLLNSDTIYEFTDKSVKPKYALDFGRYKIPPSDLKELLKRGALDTDYIRSYFSTHDCLRFGLNGFVVTDDFLVMKCDDYTCLRTVIYSVKTGQMIKIPIEQSLSDKYLGGFNFREFDGDRFCGVVPIDWALHMKKRAANTNVESQKLNYCTERIERNDILKKINENSNPIIVVFNLKSF